MGSYFSINWREKKKTRHKDNYTVQIKMYTFKNMYIGIINTIRKIATTYCD